MNILVCMKQVPDDSVEIHLNAEGTPDLANVTPVVNAFDTYALEMAARLKESSEGEITIVCVGEEGAKNSLKNCLAVGADHAFLVSDDAFKDSDTTGIANILKNVVAKLEADNGQKFDLIFTGKEATDAALGQGGLMLAEELGTSVITNITEIALDGDKVTAKQETEEGYRTVEASAPCVVTVTKPEYDPRYPTIKNKMAARKKPIGDIKEADLADLEKEKVGADNAKVQVIKLYEPAKKEAGIKIQEETEEVVIRLLKEDLYHLDKIQTQTATARLFLIAVRIKPDDQLEVHSLIHRIEKLIRMQNISVTRADKEMIKRMLAVYFEQNVTTSQFEDYDGKRWYDGVQ